MSLLIRNLTCIILLGLGLIGYSHADNPNPAQSCEIATRQVAIDGGVLYYNQAGQGAQRHRLSPDSHAHICR